MAMQGVGAAGLDYAWDDSCHCRMTFQLYLSVILRVAIDHPV